jgi:hypothetical protein
LIGMLFATEWLLRRRRFPRLAQSNDAGNVGKHAPDEPDQASDDHAPKGLKP